MLLQHSGFSVGPVLEAAIFGWLSAVPFPLGAALGSLVTSREKYRSHIAVLLSFASGCVLAAVMMEVFAVQVNEYILRATAERKLASLHPEADGTSVNLFVNDKGENPPFADQTAHAAKVCVLLLAVSAPIGALSYVGAHGLSMRALRRYKPGDTLSRDENLAAAIVLGQVVDGIPESALIGFFTLRHELSLVLLLSFAVANFPEAISVTLLGVMDRRTVTAVWGGMCFATGVLAALAAAIGKILFATMQGRVADDYTFAVVQGLAGGAMIAVVAGQYLPDAAKQLNTGVSDGRAGVPLVFGIVAAVLLKAWGGTLSLGAGHGKGNIDLPILTTNTTDFVRWGVGGADVAQL